MGPIYQMNVYPRHLSSLSVRKKKRPSSSCSLTSDYFSAFCEADERNEVKIAKEEGECLYQQSKWEVLTKSERKIEINQPKKEPIVHLKKEKRSSKHICDNYVTEADVSKTDLRRNEEVDKIMDLEKTQVM